MTSIEGPTQSRPPRATGEALAVQGLVNAVRDDTFKSEVAMALPEGVKVDRFVRATVTALLEKPGLANADRASLLHSIIKCAQDGLVPNGVQAALVTYRSKTTREGKEVWIDKVQYLPMIQGVRDILAEFGWALRTAVVYEHDEFAYDAAEQDVVHKPPRLGTDRGEAQGAYALAVHRDGNRREAVVMSREEIEYVRDHSSKGAEKGPWKEWWDRMWEKTPAHRLAKKLPLDPKDRERLERVLADERELTAEEEVARLYGEPIDISGYTEIIETSEVAEGLPTPSVDAPAEAVEGAAPTVSDPDGVAEAGEGDGPMAAAGTDGNQLPLAAPPPATDDALEAALALRPPAGRFKTATLVDLAESQPDWFAKALRHEWSERDAGFYEAVQLVAQHRLPEVFSEWLAEREGL